MATGDFEMNNVEMNNDINAQISVGGNDGTLYHDNTQADWFIMDDQFENNINIVNHDHGYGNGNLNSFNPASVLNFFYKDEWHNIDEVMQRLEKLEKFADHLLKYLTPDEYSPWVDEYKKLKSDWETENQEWETETAGCPTPKQTNCGSCAKCALQPATGQYVCLNDGKDLTVKPTFCSMFEGKPAGSLNLLTDEDFEINI